MTNEPTPRPAGLDALLDHVVERMDTVEAARQLRDALPSEQWNALEFKGSTVGDLLDRINRYEKNLPSWLHGTPEHVDAWIRNLIPDDKRLAFYRWIGAMAMREAVSDAKHQLREDPVPVERRYYSQGNVEELLDLMAPDDGDVGYPSVLPTGRPFCDVQWHAHPNGAGRLPSCRLDSEDST